MTDVGIREQQNREWTYTTQRFIRITQKGELQNIPSVNTRKAVNVLVWIHRSQVSKDKKVTYPQYTVAFQPEKDEAFRTRITAGGDQLEYLGDISTDSASMETIKTHW